MNKPVNISHRFFNKRFRPQRALCILVLSLMLWLPCGTGCKKFLNVDGLDALSGNNFWQTQQDVESYAIGVYAQMRIALISNYLYNFAGDWRFGFWGGNRNFIVSASRNDIYGIIGPGYDIWNLQNMLGDAWKSFYKMIAAANIMYTKIDEVPDPNFSQPSRKKYKAEAVYLRCLAYYFLCRMFGDVPYYTNAYNEKPIPRTNFRTIFQNCLKELNLVINDLPWTYGDPANVGVRVMRGGALVMAMDMNMWLAGFDEDNRMTYWSATDSLGNILLNGNNGAYSLVPIEKYPVIFRGKSREALIEISRNANYGENNFGFDNRGYGFNGYVVHDPVGSTQPINGPSSSISFVDAGFISKVFLPNAIDKRKTLWFSQLYAGNSNFECFKYVDFSLPGGLYNSPGLLITRLADAYLLRAEALANLGNVVEAMTMLNVVRARAGATPYSNEESLSLGDAIWNERVKEFILEGHYSFDVIRSRRVLNPDYCLRPISLEAFNNGAWTWPIPPNAFENNPLMTQNAFWNR